MIFQIYTVDKNIPKHKFSSKEIKLRDTLLLLLNPFPIHRLRIRKDYSIDINEISIDIELDSIITSEAIYNKIAHRIFKLMQLDLVSLHNNSPKTNFPYFFYGEKDILGYNCSIFLDVPKKAYIIKP